MDYNKKRNGMISYTAIVNKICSSIENKTKGTQQASTSSVNETLPVFSFKFNIKTLSINNSSHNSKSASMVLSFKFLNYPIINIPILNDSKNSQRIQVNQSSSLFFESTVSDLEHNLKTIPMVVVLLDLVSNVIIASARIHLSAFAKESFLSYNPTSKSIPFPRRKTILLFHLSDLNQPIGDIDISIVIKREYFEELDRDLANTSANKGKMICIAQPKIMNHKGNMTLPLKENHQNTITSKVSFDYIDCGNFDGEKDSMILRKNTQDTLGIFTGAKFPNPNTIFITKPIECGDLNSNRVLNSENDKDNKFENDTTGNGNYKSKVMLIKSPKKEITNVKSKHINTKKKEPLVNYDYFIRESFLNSLHNYPKSFIKVKESIVESNSNYKSNNPSSLYKSSENIDYYKEAF